MEKSLLSAEPIHQQSNTKGSISSFKIDSTEKGLSAVKSCYIWMNSVSSLYRVATAQKNREFGYHFSRQRKHREFRYNMENLDNTGNFPNFLEN